MYDNIFPELKAIDVDPTTTTITSTGTLVLLNGAAQGTDFTNRIGRKIKMTSLFIRAFIYPEDDITLESLLRVSIVYDSDANGAAPAITDILKSASPIALMNLNNRDRFEVLMDKQYMIGKTNNTATQALTNGNNLFDFKEYITLDHDTIFGGTGATIADIKTGSIYLMMISSTAGTDCPNMSYATRIRFNDS